MIYAIDANILIDFDIFVPRKIHKTFWKELKKNINAEKILVIEDIGIECKYDLGKWLKDEQIKFVKITDDVRNRSIEINNQYQMITLGPNKIKQSEADPVLIAYAEKNKYTVLTREKLQREEEIKTDDAYKIPTVCKKLNVRFERIPSRMFENLNFPKI